MKKTADAVVLGGGVMGASTIYHLAKRGMKNVVLLEKNYLASGPTGRSVAHIRPYHGVEETVKIIHRANQIYLNFKEEVGGDAEFNKVGRIWAEPAADKELVEKITALSRKAGMKVQSLSMEELQAMIPGLNTEGLGVAMFFPEAGYSNPSAVTKSFAQRAQDMGAQIVEGTEATGVSPHGGRVTSVATSSGVISTPVVVNAAGIWSRGVARMAGLDLPIVVKRHQGVVFKLPWDLPPFAPILHDGRTDYVYRCGPEGLMKVMWTQDITQSEEVDPDHMPDYAEESTLNHALEWCLHTFPAFPRASYRGGYSCAFDMTPDESPIIEQAEELDGFYNLVGWGGLGMQQGPAVGDLMAELITTGRTSLVDVSIFNSRRFKENKPLASAWLFGEIGVH